MCIILANVLVSCVKFGPLGFLVVFWSSGLLAWVKSRFTDGNLQHFLRVLQAILGILGHVWVCVYGMICLGFCCYSWCWFLIKGSSVGMGDRGFWEKGERGVVGGWVMMVGLGGEGRGFIWFSRNGGDGI